jgi:hypothetical protein
MIVTVFYLKTHEIGRDHETDGRAAPARPAKLPEGICRYLGHGAGRPAG